MRRAAVWGVACIVLGAALGLGALELRQRHGNRLAADRFAAERPHPLGDFGSTTRLTILPLVDWHVSRPDLKGELGLSYLIETDEDRILFDVAHNAQGESPSPLEHNMEALGIDWDSIETVFISHNHLDHVGGLRRQLDATFAIGLDPKPLAHPRARAFVPTPMRYPGIEPVHTGLPRSIGTGVATTGTIGRQLVLGWIDEQSLAIHVEGRGVILIVGCGHQPIPNLLRRYDAVFDERLYGIVGGLHLPVPEGRMKLFGIDGQRRFASGDGLFAALTMADVEELRDELRGRELGLIGVGGHDSSDEAIALFAEAFGDTFRHVRVGDPILVGPPD